MPGLQSFPLGKLLFEIALYVYRFLKKNILSRKMSKGIAVSHNYDTIDAGCFLSILT